MINNNKKKAYKRKNLLYAIILFLSYSYCFILNVAMTLALLFLILNVLLLIL